MTLISKYKAYEVLTEYYHHTTEEQHKALREALDRVPEEDAVRLYPSLCKMGRDKFIIYNRDWLYEHLEQEFEIQKSARDFSEKMKNTGLPAADIVFKFLEAQDKAEEAGLHEFTCPICGGKATWYRSAYNNHLHSHCEKCGAGIVE